MAKDKAVMERPDLEEMVGFIHAIADEGSPKGLRVICQINRLLSQSWPDIVHDTIDGTLDAAEMTLLAKDIDTEIL